MSIDSNRPLVPYAYAHLNHGNSKLRSYPLKCLHNVVLTEFPSKPETRKSIFIKAHTVPLYCSRRMPETILCSNVQSVNIGSTQTANRPLSHYRILPVSRDIG